MLKIINNYKKNCRYLSLQIFFFLFVFTGCASVKFYDENGNDIGFEYHPAKPYLLIETDDKGAQKAKIISIPDVSKTRYIKHRGGWGTVDFNFKSTDSILTEFGEKLDSKGPETITAITSGVSSVATGIGALSLGIGEKVEEDQVFKVNKVLEAIGTLKHGIEELPVQLDASEKEGLVLVDIRTRLENILTELVKLTEFKGKNQSILDEFLKNRKAVAEIVPKLKIEVDVLKTIAKADAKDYKVYNKKANNALEYLKESVKSLTDYAGDQTPKIQLFEIQYNNDSKKIQFVPRELL